jgi:hypothetical protein
MSNPVGSKLTLPTVKDTAPAVSLQLPMASKLTLPTVKDTAVPFPYN